MSQPRQGFINKGFPPLWVSYRMKCLRTQTWPNLSWSEFWAKLTAVYNTCLQSKPALVLVACQDYSICDFYCPSYNYNPVSPGRKACGSHRRRNADNVGHLLQYILGWIQNQTPFLPFFFSILTRIFVKQKTSSNTPVLETTYRFVAQVANSHKHIKCRVRTSACLVAFHCNPHEALASPEAWELYLLWTTW